MSGYNCDVAKAELHRHTTDVVSDVRRLVGNNGSIAYQVGSQKVRVSSWRILGFGGVTVSTGNSKDSYTTKTKIRQLPFLQPRVTETITNSSGQTILTQKHPDASIATVQTVHEFTEQERKEEAVVNSYKNEIERLVGIAMDNHRIKTIPSIPGEPFVPPVQHIPYNPHSEGQNTELEEVARMIISVGSSGPLGMNISDMVRFTTSYGMWKEYSIEKGELVEREFDATSEQVLKKVLSLDEGTALVSKLQQLNEQHLQ